LEVSAVICEECGQPFAPSGRGKKAKYCSAKCKQRAYRRAKRMSRVTTPPAPAGNVEHEPEAMDTLTAADFEAMMNDGPEDYVSVLKRTQARLKEAMFSAGTPPGSLTGISKQLLALTREIERLEGNPAQGMTTQEDPEDDDDDGEFRPEAI
jgi:hypothetical protein